MANQDIAVVPLLSVRNGARAIEFYKTAFGAREVFRVDNEKGEVVGQLSVSQADFWLADESPQHGSFSPESLGGGTIRLLLILDDPDAAFERAVTAGAKAISAVGNQHGWRVGRVADPFGHHWEICAPPMVDTVIYLCDDGKLRFETRTEMIQSDRITRTTLSRLRDARKADVPFGTVLSDHMLVADYAEGQWQLPAIQPYGPLPLPPAPSAVQYGQAIFEGFKAQALADGGVALFRPGDNHARFNRTAARLAMPEIPASLFVDGIAELVRTDRDWVPRSPGGALYVRPVLFATDEALQVRPASHYRFVTVTSPVGPYFSGPIHLIAEERYVRAFRGGTGDVKPAGNYAPSLIAALEAQARGYHAVVWLDAVEHRWVEESGLMNIMLVVDGGVVTPPLTGTILPGITRASLITVLADMGVNVEERPIEISEVFELAAAKRLTEAAGIGTAATVAPIGRLRWRDQEIDLTPAPGGLLERARAQLDRIRTGEALDRHGWLLKI